VKGFGWIVKPLTTILKQDGFLWLGAATESFQQLKKALTKAPVLALPNFQKKFVVEIDALGMGVGVVLMQDQYPIAFISRTLNNQQQALPTYEKELLVVVFVVQK